MTKENFFKKRCIRTDNRIQRTSCFSHTMSIGYTYQMFICLVTLEPFNPYLKINENREYKIFQSSISSYDCKQKAWEYINQNHQYIK